MKQLELKLNPLTITFELEHRVDGLDTLKEKLHLQKNEQWSAHIPAIYIESDDPNEAVKELGAVLFRLSEAIHEADGEFSKLDLSQVKIS